MKNFSDHQKTVNLNNGSGYYPEIFVAIEKVRYNTVERKSFNFINNEILLYL
jgi:hypothetical protein